MGELFFKLISKFGPSNCNIKPRNHKRKKLLNDTIKHPNKPMDKQMSKYFYFCLIKTATIVKQTGEKYLQYTSQRADFIIFKQKKFPKPI